MKTTDKIKEETIALLKQIRAKQAEFRKAQRDCNHEWGGLQFDYLTWKANDERGTTCTSTIQFFRHCNKCAAVLVAIKKLNSSVPEDEQIMDKLEAIENMIIENPDEFGIFEKMNFTVWIDPFILERLIEETALYEGDED